MRKFLNAVVGLLVGAAAGALLVWQRLLIYTEATKRPLVAGGVFGLVGGAITALVAPIHKKNTIRKVVAVVSVIGLFSLAGFGTIVYGELNFTGRAAVLYLLPFLTAFSLSFLATLLLEIKSR